jgi:microcystin-dependent protein
MSYRRSAITPSNFKLGNSVLMNNVIDNQPYLYPVKDLYILNDNIHLGTGAGGIGVTSYIYQGTGSIAIGGYSSQNYQGKYSVSVGYEASQQHQGDYSVAIGYEAGQNNQGTGGSGYSVAVGPNAGQNDQQTQSVAIGPNAGQTNQQANSIAIGFNAGYENQGTTVTPTAGYAIAIGYEAGYSNQGDHTIAIGNQAGYNGQDDFSIILNATNSSLDTSSTGGFFVKPINRNENYDDFKMLRYNETSGEIVYSYPIPGVISMYGGTASPMGHLFCDGTEVSRTTYSRLFDVIGTIYGAGDNVNTFNLPNLQGRVPVGLKASEPVFNALGNVGGTGAHTLSVNEMPSHNHSITDPGHTHSYFNQSNDHEVAVSLTTTDTADNVDVNQTTGSSSTGITINNTGGGLAHNNLQPYIVLNYIISY